MREAHFVKKNKEKWKLFEDVLDKKQEINPTTLSDLYIDITDDSTCGISFDMDFLQQTVLNQRDTCFLRGDIDEYFL